jgi:hypothetical protein
MAERQGLGRASVAAMRHLDMSIEDEDRLLEHGVLATILSMHPEHLTTAELVLKIAGDQEPSGEESIRQAIRNLKGSGLLRRVGDVVQPTHAAIRMDELIG